MAMSLEEAIKTAIEYEKKVRDTYLGAVGAVQDSTGKKAMEILAEEEQAHVDYLAAKFVEWKQTGNITAEELETAIPPVDVIAREIERLKAAVSEKKTAASTDVEVLKRAYEVEKETSGFYRRMVSELPESDRPLFERFLEIEEGHLAIVQAELDAVEGNGFWFDIAEFDLETG